MNAVIRDLARRQHGVVARSQLLEAGVPVHAIDNRLKAGRLDGLFRGVYGVGPVRAPLGREMAAVLACGEHSVLSHDSAGALWSLRTPESHEGGIEVSLQRGDRNPGPGVRVHRVAPLEVDEVTVLEGIPITTPARTLLDLAPRLGGRELERALARLERRSPGGRSEVEMLLARYPRRPGTRVLRSLTADGGPALTRSEAESRFLALVRKARLAGPEANARVRGYEVDFFWRVARLVVEIDGFAFHGSSDAFERDRQRDALLVAAGFRVVRVTWRQLVREPEVVLARLAQALVR